MVPTNQRIRELFAQGKDTLDIARLLLIPESRVLFKLNLSRRLPAPYGNPPVWPQDPMFVSREAVIQARQSGVWKSRVRK